MGAQTRTLAGRTLIWAAVSAIAVFVQLLWTPSSFVDGSYRPIGNDSFYHAQRIRSAVLDPSSFREFDPRIDAPRGTLLIWPWGYDWTVAAAVRAARTFGLVGDPMHAIVLAPVVAVALSIALVVTIASLLELSLAGTFLAALFVALSPLTQLLHSIGVVDHHYAEYILVLAALASGLGWMASPDALRRAIVAGVLLGIAPACHPALFLLQVPILATLGLLWLRASPVPSRAVVAFGLSLVLATGLVLLPSEPFRRGLFEFYRLSWFQLYVATSTALLAFGLARLPRTLKGFAALAALSLVLALPLLGQLAAADRFLARDFGALASIHEAQSLLAMLREPGGPAEISRLYSLFIWLAPLLAAGSLWALWRRPDPRLTFFHVAALGGLAMLLAMFRFHDYGSFALCLLPLFWIERLHGQGRLTPRQSQLVSGLVVLVAMAPSIRLLLASNPGPGGEPYYAVTRAIYPALAKACAREPGIVLASNNDGHYVLFHTDCPVIATNFLVTRQDEAALAETDRLLALTPAELLESGAQVRYVLARGQRMLAADERGALSFVDRSVVAQYSPPLVSQLLFGDPRALGPRFRLLGELRLAGPGGYPYARLFEIVPEASGP